MVTSVDPFGYYAEGIQQHLDDAFTGPAADPANSEGSPTPRAAKPGRPSGTQAAQPAEQPAAAPQQPQPQQPSASADDQPQPGTMSNGAAAASSAPGQVRAAGRCHALQPSQHRLLAWCSCVLRLCACLNRAASWCP